MVPAHPPHAPHTGNTRLCTFFTHYRDPKKPLRYPQRCPLSTSRDTLLPSRAFLPPAPRQRGLCGNCAAHIDHEGGDAIIARRSGFHETPSQNMQYTIVTTRFEDISGVVTSGRSPRTSFNATIEGKRYCGLDVAGIPDLESGMTVTAALRTDGDWYSLAGWMNHGNGEIEGITEPAISLVIALVIAIAAVMMLYAFASRGGIAARDAVLPVVFGIVSVGMLVECLNVLNLKKQLRAVAG